MINLNTTNSAVLQPFLQNGPYPIQAYTIFLDKESILDHLKNNVSTEYEGKIVVALNSKTEGDTITYSPEAFIVSKVDETTPTLTEIGTGSGSNSGNGINVVAQESAITPSTDTIGLLYFAKDTFKLYVIKNATTKAEILYDLTNSTNGLRIQKLTNPSSGAVASYLLKLGNITLGDTIDITDLVVLSGEYNYFEKSKTPGISEDGYYLKLTIGTNNHVYIPVGDLIEDASSQFFVQTLLNAIKVNVIDPNAYIGTTNIYPDYNVNISLDNSIVSVYSDYKLRITTNILDTSAIVKTNIQEFSVTESVSINPTIDLAEGNTIKIYLNVVKENEDNTETIYNHTEIVGNIVLPITIKNSTPVVKYNFNRNYYYIDSIPTANSGSSSKLASFTYPKGNKELKYIESGGIKVPFTSLTSNSNANFTDVTISNIKNTVNVLSNIELFFQ